jgi:hypothetical protein
MFNTDLSPSFMKIDDKYVGYVKIKVTKASVIKDSDIINDKQQIILIIDNSGSMSNKRIKYVIEAYTNLLNKINNKNIYITLITFNHNTNILYENVIITDLNINTYINIVQNISTFGTTDICPSIDLALTKKKENYNCNIIIFTDGEDDNIISQKNRLYSIFTNETFHVCGIGSESIKLINHLSDCAKIKTINIIDKLDVINNILNNLLHYMDNNINENIIINNNYYQTLNNETKLIPLEPLEEITDFRINFKLGSNNIEIICDLSNVKLFDINCIQTELERLNVKFNMIMSVEIVNNNSSDKLNNIITEFNDHLQKLKDVCDANSVIITELKNYNKYINDIALIKNTIDDIDDDVIDNYSLMDIANRSLSNAITVRSQSLLY